MEFRMTNYGGLNVKNYEQAVAFYRDTLGWELLKYTDTESKFKKGDTYFFVEKEDKNAYAVFFEYEVDDIATALATLQQQGCTIRQQYGPQSIMLTDPYGTHFHVYQKGAALPGL